MVKEIIKIINFKSAQKNNFFAPEWNYYIFESKIHKINFNNLSKCLLKKEKEILIEALLDTLEDVHMGLLPIGAGSGRGTSLVKPTSDNSFDRQAIKDQLTAHQPSNKQKQEGVAA